MDLLFRKEDSSAPREPPWLRACIKDVGIIYAHILNEYVKEKEKNTA